jgi:outer membrane protein assembly factor BamB
VTLAGVEQLLLVVEGFVCGHDPVGGDLLWEHPWPSNSTADASASQAIALNGDRVFVSKGYARGSALLQVTQDNANGWSAEEIWYHPTIMKTKFANVVVYQDHVFGLDDVILECLDLETGRKKWKRGRYGYGQLLRLGEVLLVQSEWGELAVVEARPDRHVELCRFQALEGKSWNTLCLHGPFLLLRNAEQAACYRLPEPSPRLQGQAPGGHRGG